MRSDRRRWLGGLGAMAAAGLASPFDRLARAAAPEAGGPRLAAVRDEATGWPLLELPDGFRYRSYGWTGDPMDDGRPTPPLHDGMGVVQVRDGRVTLIRNHEVRGTGPSLAPAALTYDRSAPGGATHLQFDAVSGEWLGSRTSLGGTSTNCAGGPTPWGSWLSCEETSVDTSDGFERSHGWVFEVPADGAATAQPLTALGRFHHEACAVDPASGIVYQTEDNHPSGVYRFLPTKAGDLALGGRLQMMRVRAPVNGRVRAGAASWPTFDTSVGGWPAGTTWDVDWVDIDDPQAAGPVGARKGSGVCAQGLVQGASSFRRGEGLWFGAGLVFICATSGGAARCGQVFAHDPVRQTLRLIYESAGAGVCDQPDNIVMSPGGGLVLCEDADNPVSRLHALDMKGAIRAFCRNHVDFSDSGIGPVSRPSGRRWSRNFRDSEFCGAAFHGDWLFVNIQWPGVTVAITGPWSTLGL